MMTFLAATSAAAEGEGIVFAFQNMVVGLGTVFLVLAFLIHLMIKYREPPKKKQGGSNHAQ